MYRLAVGWQRLREMGCWFRGGHDWHTITDYDPIKYCLRCTYWEFL